MRAWWAYWLTLLVGAIAWIAGALAAGRDGFEAALHEPIWAAILITPIFLAGLNLVLFRDGHEVICRLEVERHPWMSHFVGRGYSSGTFALTGVMVLALGLLIVISLFGGSI